MTGLAQINWRAMTILAHRLSGDTAEAVQAAFGPNHSLPELIEATGKALDG